MNAYENRLSLVKNEILEAKNTSTFNEIIKLIAVSKMVEYGEVKKLFEIGQVAFGENRVQSLKEKYDNLKNFKIEWHFIGRLQKNKINQLLSMRPTLIHSCDSLNLAKEIDQRVSTFKPDVLLQINSAKEGTKTGVMPEIAIDTYQEIKSTCKNINLCGVMSIGAHTDDERIIQKSFETTREIFDILKKDGAKYCSIGMSSDYKLAVKCGSNMLRVGSALFK